MNILEIPATSLGDKLAPTLEPGQKRGKCPTCKETDWWERPDGTAVCGHCVRHNSTHGPNSNGDYTWCPQCCAAYWREVEKYARRAR